MVNVVVTCTARKTEIPPRDLMMRTLRRDDLEYRFTEWQNRLESARGNRTSASNLYCGNAWSIIRDVYDDKNSVSKFRFWVVSAGYGLISMNDQLLPYAATFSPGEEDAVVPSTFTNNQISEWWSFLIARRRKQCKKIASIEDIAEAFPDDPLVVAFSKDYLRAVVHDLDKARIT